MSFEGWTASVYATYIQDQFFIDGQIKGDFLDSAASAGGVSGNKSVDTWGGQVEAGYRWPVGTGTLEPVGTLAFTETNISSLALAGTTVDWGDENSFRGAIGLRYSVPIVTNDQYLLKLAVDGRVWDEFDGNNKVTLINAGNARAGRRRLLRRVRRSGRRSEPLQPRWPLERLRDRVLQVQGATTTRARSPWATGISGALRRRRRRLPRRLRLRRLPRRRLRRRLPRRRLRPRTSSSTSRSISTC